MDERKGGAATKEGREKKEGEGEKEEGEGEKEKGAGEKEEKDEKKQGAGVVRPCSSICVIGLTQMPTAHVHAHAYTYAYTHAYTHVCTQTIIYTALVGPQSTGPPTSCDISVRQHFSYSLRDTLSS